MFENSLKLRVGAKTENMAENSHFLIFRELDDQPSPGTENRSVGGSIPPLGTLFRRIAAGHAPFAGRRWSAVQSLAETGHSSTLVVIAKLRQGLVTATEAKPRIQR